MAIHVDLYDLGEVKKINRVIKPNFGNDYEGITTIDFESGIKIVIPAEEYGYASFGNITLSRLYELNDKFFQEVYVKPFIEKPKEEDTIGDSILPESTPPVLYDLDDEIPF